MLLYFLVALLSAGGLSEAGPATTPGWLEQGANYIKDFVEGNRDVGKQVLGAVNATTQAGASIGSGAVQAGTDLSIAAANAASDLTHKVIDSSKGVAQQYLGVVNSLARVFPGLSRVAIEAAVSGAVAGVGASAGVASWSTDTAVKITKAALTALNAVSQGSTSLWSKIIGGSVALSQGMIDKIAVSITDRVDGVVNGIETLFPHYGHITS